MIGMPKNIPLSELKLIIRFYDEGYKQREIKDLVDAERRRLGTYKGKGISTNTISKLSPTSKHRHEFEMKTRRVWGYQETIDRIMRCLRVSETIASKKYTKHIYLSGIAPEDFYDPNQRNLVSIRFNAPSDCKASLYFAFTSEDYIEDDDIDDPNIWTVKTPFNYTDVITGRLPYERVDEWLQEMGGGEYIPIFINTLIYKRIDD